MNNEKKVAIVTGANRGLGFEVCRQLAKQDIRVILTSRNRGKGKMATSTLQSEGLDVTYFRLDVLSTRSINQLIRSIQRQYNRLDILVNNAGIFPKVETWNSSIFNARIETLRSAMETNVYGVLSVSQAVVPLMKKHSYGRIVNLSSGLGQLSEMKGLYPGYRISKTALNAVTRMLADELKETNILVNSVCPGWVKTEMGGSNAQRTPEEGAETIVWLATLPDGSPSGGFFRDKQPIPW